jgi:hypothetical protein
MNLFSKCHNCNKQFGLFEKTYKWFGLWDEGFKYCYDCNQIMHGKGHSKYSKKSKKPFEGYCDFCNEKIKSSIINAFYCKYCDEWHCNIHRLPENHECPNPKKPEGL